MTIHPPTLPPFRQRLARAGAFLSLATVVIFGLALPHAALAGTPKKVKPRPPFLPPYDVIKSVDATKRTITVGHVNSKDNSVKTFTLSNTCEIQVNGAKAEIGGLSAGLKVSVTRGGDDTVADRIVAGPAPAPAPRAEEITAGRRGYQPAEGAVSGRLPV